MLDEYFWGEIERISPEAPVPVLQLRRAEHMLGGAANVARNLASMGARVSAVGVAGTDTAGGGVARAPLPAGGGPGGEGAAAGRATPRQEPAAVPRARPQTGPRSR